jgi:Uma2 family endonuclease
MEVAVPATGERSGTRGPWTYERLAAATPEDTVRREIVDGWLYIDGQRVDDPYTEVAAESSVPFHGDAVRELLIALAAYRGDHHGQVYTAPLDVAFGEQVLQPDLFWLPYPAPRHERPIRIRPDLVIEVSSPSTRGHDLVRKGRIYEQAGVPEYWFVDIDAERFECYRLAGDAYEAPALVPRGEDLRSIALPGFQVAVDDVLGPADERDAG